MGHVKKVLEALKHHRLQLDCKKCEFGQSSLVYLDFVIGDGELCIDPDKVIAIQEWPTLQIVIEVRSFVGAKIISESTRAEMSM